MTDPTLVERLLKLAPIETAIAREIFAIRSKIDPSFDEPASLISEAEVVMRQAAARIAALEAEVARLKREIGEKDRVLHEKNLALDAMGWVWCDGGCKGGTGRFTDFELTEDHVAMMERQAKRARTYHRNRNYRANRADRAALENSHEG